MYDASQDVIDLKSDVKVIQEQNTELRGLVKSLADTVNKQSVVLKSMGTVAIEDSVLLKSIADTPQPRVTEVKNLKAFERFEKSQVEELGKVDQARLTKAMVDNKVSGEDQATANLMFRRGGIAAVDPVIVDLLLVKE